MFELNEEVLNKVRELFPNKKIVPRIEANVRDEDKFIQISTAFTDSLDNIHYELYRGKVELHFEGKYKEKEELINLIKYLEGSIKWDDYKWEDWECGYRCQWTQKLTTDNYRQEIKIFIEKFDKAIREFIYPFLKFKPQDDVDMRKQNVPVSVYENKNLEAILKLDLAIPDYQRIYCWEDKNITDLWNNLIEIPDGVKYHLGALILHKNKKGGKYNIIDGQQRLVTLSLILWEIGYKEPTALLKECFLSEEAREHIANAKWLVENLSKEIENGRKEDFIDKLTKNLVFSVLVLSDDNLDLAYTFFSNQNSKGVPLSDYDLLKAHHLRYIHIEEQQEHLARQWNSKTKDEEGIQSLSEVLGTHLYRLRNWMRKRAFDENKRLRVKEEFSAAPIVRGIPPFGERFEYYEKIQGGAHFFAYTDHFLDLYKVFSETRHVKLLREHLQYATNYRYESVIETLLFAYYLKFGNQYLSEALFCIAGVMAQHRYSVNRALRYRIREYASNSEIVMMIDQATSPTFFLAEALSLIKISGKSNKEIRGIKESFYQALKRIFNELNDFTDKTINYKQQEAYGGKQ